MSELEYELPHHKIKEEGEELEPLPIEPLLTLDQICKKEIAERMKFLNNNKTKVAESLGITVKTLYSKLHQYGWMESGRCRKF
jgi:DNA-binding NtrC family response regulator